MSEMVERVEIAINAETNRINALPWAERAVAERNMGSLLARAAIEAMREPTMPMLHAAYHLMDGEPECQCMSPGLYVEWKTMIDEALK